jgi:hypothetical protein
MQQLTATRLLNADRRGSSRPFIVDTDDGPLLVKLRGAAQGTAPLAAEIIVGELAEALGLAVPARSLVEITPEITIDDRDAEVHDLLRFSYGTNLGFALLPEPRDVAPSELASISADERTSILWLDRLVLNPDRTLRNPNLLWSLGRLWLIDHGAALGFHYDWASVDESAPRRRDSEMEPHLFAPFVTREELEIWDELLATRLTRDTLQAAADAVPESFLAAGRHHDAVPRRRAAYVAFLWKRLKSPRTFLDDPERIAPPASRGRPPGWLWRR